MARTVEYIMSLKDRVSGVLQKIQKGFKATEQAGEQTTQNMGNSFKKLSTIVGTVAVAAFGKFAFNATADLEKTKVSFGVLLGSMDKGLALTKELEQLANTTPLQNQDVNKAAQTLLAFGIEGDKVTKTLKMMGDVGLGDAEKMKSLSLAFGQIKASGRLMGQEVLQMVNAGFNPLKVMSDKSGKSMLELKKAMEKGLISFKDVENAFKVATGEGGKYHNMMEQMSKTMAGRLSTVQGGFTSLIAQLGENFAPAIGVVLDSMISIINIMIQYKDVVFVVVSAMTALTIAIGAYYAATKIGVMWTVLMTKAQWLLNIALNANPIGLVVVAVVTLTAALTAAYYKFAEFRRFMNGTWDAMKVFGSGVLEFMLNPLGKVFDLINSLIPAFQKMMNFDFSGAITEMKKAFASSGIVKAFNTAGSENRFSDGGLIGPENQIETPQASGFQFANAALNGGVDGKGTTAGQSLIKSGGVKSFNINIQQVVGVENMNTSGIQQTSEDTGQAVLQAILGSIADVAPR